MSSCVPNLTLVTSFEEPHNDAPPPKKARFATCGREEMDRIVDQRVPASTKQTTEKWLRVVDEYMKEKGMVWDLRTAKEEDIASFLERFYVEVRSKDGGFYSKASFNF